MRTLMFLLIIAALVTTAALVTLVGGGTTTEATHGNFMVHVHDNFYHPMGGFIVGTGTDHAVAKAACEKANPDAACDAVIHAGDSITWVAPPPLAMNPHTVTECTDNTFSTCGPSVDPGNPIGDSGARNPPPDVPPLGWPYGPVTFYAPGTYYYLCEIHPSVMRGRIVVQPLAVGGVVDDLDHSGHALLATDDDDSSSTGGNATLATALASGSAAFLVVTGAAWYARKRWRR